MTALSAFAEGLLTRETVVPEGVIAPDGTASAKRFSVYRNNAASTLIEALGNNFPLGRMLVGERFFDAMAQVHHGMHPPRSPLLFRYGDTFPDFVAGFEPAASVPYLADVARLEWAWLQAFHAADAAPIGADALATVAPDDLAALRFQLHPALAALRSPFPAVSIAVRLREGRDLAGLDLSHGEDALVTRPGFEVELRELPPGGFEFLSALAESPFGEAAARASAIWGFDLAANIAELFAAGGVVGLHIEKEPEC